MLTVITKQVQRTFLSHELVEARFSMVEALLSGTSITVLEQMSRGVVVGALVVIVVVTVAHRVHRSTKSKAHKSRR